MLGSVLFHRPGDLQASAVIRGSWKRSPAKLAMEFLPDARFGNDVHDACTAFIGWCLARSPSPGTFIVHSLPGLPWDEADHDPWEWYERLMAEVAKWDPPPVLVDLDDFVVTHRDEVLWPPPDERRERRTDRRSRSADSPFPAGWFGQDLGEFRPGEDTYNCYPPEELPTLRIPLAGTFDWLRSAPEHERSVAPDPGRIAAALDQLVAANLAGLPPEFVEFFRSPDLWRRIRSCTDCGLRLDSVAVGIRGGLGSLVRFLSDSQGCKHWHLYLSPCGTKHSVVATYFHDGSESGGVPHPKDVTLCASSFEEFLYRFWLENGVWLALHDLGTMPEGGEEYLDYYRPNTRAN